MAKKKALARAKTASPRTTRTARAASPGTTAIAAIESPADGVRALRDRLEAQSSDKKAERLALLDALSSLEEDYKRVTVGRGAVRAVLMFRASASAGQKSQTGVELPVFEAQLRRDATFVPTPQDLVDAMLRMAEVTKDDVLYDLGSGDGRIVITAAKQFGAQAVGIDKDPDRIAEATANAARAGVGRRATFIQGDLFDTDIRQATVVLLYLLPSLNLELKERLLKQLKPGSRIVSHAFDMGEWQPAKKLEIAGRTAYLWVVPDV